MNLILIAPPAAGKGTLASKLIDKYGLISISAGELLRGVDENTELGQEIRRIQATRQLVDNKITNALMKERLSKSDILKHGFILDGYPRSMEQVEAITEMCKELGIKIDYAVLLNVPYDVALKRTLGRQICPKCKKTYNKLTGSSVPKVENMCDECKIELTTRNDDNEETLKKGFEVYNKNALPVVEHYRNLGMLVEIDSTHTPEETFKEFERLVINK